MERKSSPESSTADEHSSAQLTPSTQVPSRSRWFASEGRRLAGLTGGLVLALVPGIAQEIQNTAAGRYEELEKILEQAIQDAPMSEAELEKIERDFDNLNDIREFIQKVQLHNEPYVEAPTFVSVVSSDEIRKSGYRSLAEILRSVPSLHVSYDRNYSYLGVRGFNRADYNGRVLVLVNGHRVNNNLSDGAYIGSSFILDVDLIDRVEVARGPGSVLYGNNAFFGVINVITRKGLDTEEGQVGGEVSGSVGAFDAYQARATFGRGIDALGDTFGVLFSGTYYDRGGDPSLYFPEYDNPGSNFGIAENLDADEVWNAFGSIGWADGLTLEGAWIDREKRIPTAPIGTEFNNPDTKSQDERGYAKLDFNRELKEDMTLAARVHYDRYLFDGYYPYAGTPDNRQQYWGDWWGGEADLQYQPIGWYQFRVGAEYRDDFRQDVLITELPGTPIFDVKQTRQSTGVYFHNTITVLAGEDDAGGIFARTPDEERQETDGLYVDAGVRYDHFTSFGDSVNPRAALIYSPASTFLKESTMKFVYGTAFRAPNVRELIFSPDLDAEKVSTYEFIFERPIWGVSNWDPALGFFERTEGPPPRAHYLRGTLALFYNDIDDLIAFDSVSQQLRNLQGAKSMGVEPALIGYFSGKSLLGGDGMYQASVSYTYQDTEDDATGEILTDSPRHLAKARLSVPLVDDNWFLTGEYQYTSERTTVKGGKAPGYGLANIVLLCKDLVGRDNVDYGLTLSIGVYNLFDRKYEDPAGPFFVQDTLEQDGRTFQLKLNYAF